MRLIQALVFLLLLPSLAWAVIDVYEFETPEQEARFERLTAELRCPKCQNQNIAASNAPIAEDMRVQVHQRIRAGQSDDQIIAAMVERFGEFVRYRPPLNLETLFLWFGPVLLGIFGLVLIFVVVRRSQRGDVVPLSTAERARVDSLLGRNSVPDQKPGAEPAPGTGQNRPRGQ